MIKLRSILEALGIKRKNRTKYPIRLETFGFMEKAPKGVATTTWAYGTVTYIYEDGIERVYNKRMGPFGITIH